MGEICVGLFVESVARVCGSKQDCYPYSPVAVYEAIFEADISKLYDTNSVRSSPSAI